MSGVMDQCLGGREVRSLDRMMWPSLTAHCCRFEISRPALEQIAREIRVNPENFIAGLWIDGIYTRPNHICRLAQIVDERGIPSDWKKSLSS